jgi:hypothetical protein
MRVETLQPGADARKVILTMFKSARARITALVLSGVVAASSGCGIDNVTSSKAGTPVSLPGVSSFVPGGPNKLLFGIPDGVYTFVVRPGQAASLDIGGTSRLDLPANAICSLALSGYGSDKWDAPCVPEQLPVTIVVTSQGAGTATPRLTFYPAMRFNPQTEVKLYMYGKDVSTADALNWLIYYCPSSGSAGCVNEGATDASLTSYVDQAHSVVFRRIKHFSDYELSFSGYVVGN